MYRFFRWVAEWANLFHGAFGSGLKRPFSREALEDLIGPVGTKIVLGIPVVTVSVWLLLWIASRIFDLPDGGDPFSWIRTVFDPGSPGKER